MTKTLLLCSALVAAAFTQSYAQAWGQMVKITALDRDASDAFGGKVAIDGDHAIVGAYNEGHDEAGANMVIQAGSAYVYRKEGNSWVQQQKLVAPQRFEYDQFSISVAISGDYAIVGSVNHNYDADGANFIHNRPGAAYIYKQTGGVWVLQQKIVAADRGPGEQFGGSVSISGEYAIIGAIGQGFDENGLNFAGAAGAAYIFKRTGEVWTQHQKIVAADRQVGDAFGVCVSMKGNFAIIGAYGEDHDADGTNMMDQAGSAYIFSNNAGVWSQQQKIVASDRETMNSFGGSVSIDGDHAVVGANSDSDEFGENHLSGAGAAYIFRYADGIWTQQQKIVASDRRFEDLFGGVSISGNNIIVSAHWQDYNSIGTEPVNNAGAVYIFTQTDGTWVQQQKVTPHSSDRGISYQFGVSVAISGNTFIAGQFSPTDSNGENYMISAGAAYVSGTGGSLGLTDQTMVPIHLHPNPASSSITLNTGSLNGNGTATITDMSGRAVSRLSLSSPQTAIDISDLRAGMYLLHFSDERSSGTVRFLKQ